RVGGDAVAILAAQQPPHGHAERLAGDVPEGDVDAADRRHRDAATSHGREETAFAGAVVGAGAAVEGVPDGGDIGRVTSDDGGPEVATDEGDHPRVVAEIADADLRFAEPRETGVGVDLDQAGIE